ncbi:MAG: MauE/DoxX family redox-associated membrane protein [Pseudohongiellaceae bacterium]
MLAGVLSWVIALCCSLLFVTAGLQKLADLPRHRELLADYRVLPARWLTPVARVLPWLELAVGVAWLAAPMHAIAAAASAALLTIYALAMGINLRRGRHHISCGCGGVSAGGTTLISSRLVWRNLLLACLALWAGQISVLSGWTWLHGLTVLVASLSITLLYGTAQQLFANGEAIRQWRVRRA